MRRREQGEMVFQNQLKSDLIKIYLNHFLAGGDGSDDSEVDEPPVGEG